VRSRIPLILAGAIVVVAVGGFLASQQFLAGDDVARLTLPPDGAVATGAAPAEPTASAGPGAGGEPTAGGGSARPADLAGTWSVADGSVVGYRVREQLGGVSALTDAVGRTSAVGGSATLELAGDSVRVVGASFEADLTRLVSDNARRDNRIRTSGLESDAFPIATFVLAEAIGVPGEALAGATVDVTLTGDLTIHGVTRRVSITGQARLNGSRIEVVGALTFPFADFKMTPPDIAGFVRVEDDATLELLLSLARD
jgi:polyisoprenoid-binding protein YceI